MRCVYSPVIWRAAVAAEAAVPWVVWAAVAESPPDPASELSLPWLCDREAGRSWGSADPDPQNHASSEMINEKKTRQELCTVLEHLVYRNNRHALFNNNGFPKSAARSSPFRLEGIIISNDSFIWKMLREHGSHGGFVICLNLLPHISILQFFFSYVLHYPHWLLYFSKESRARKARAAIVIDVIKKIKS